MWKEVNIKNNTTNSIIIDISDVTENISGIRYIYGDMGCCKEYFNCVIKQCPLYGINSKLPVPPFRLSISNNKCTAY